MYLDSPRDEVSQGDLFLDVPFVRTEFSPAGDVVALDIDRHPALLLSHDCEYDKPRVHAVLVARIRPLADLVPSSQGNARWNRIRSVFYLAASPPYIPESIVDLEQIVPVQKSEIARLALVGKRFASLTDEAREALQDQIWMFLTRAPDHVSPEPATE